MLKTIFFGTPGVAVPFLEELARTTQVLMVITQPDRPFGRGLEIKPCPIKKRAQELGLPVLSPEKFKDIVPQIAELKADLGLAVAYGKIFRKPAIDALKYGILNVHFSLLPKYRGAAPVQYTLFNNEEKSGVSLFWIDEGLDTGKIAAQKQIAILPQDNSITLFEKLTNLGLEATKEVLQDIQNGKITKIEQTGTPSLAPTIQKEDCLVNFTKMTALEIHGKVRGLASAMPAYARALTPQGQSVQILKTSLPKDLTQTNAKPGTLLSIVKEGGFFIQCIEGVLLIESLKPSGKNIMSAKDYANGRSFKAGSEVFL
ncbi:MAG: methionyl-tRNA formyltransferase [Elusimicrobiaceae bacterium]|nr:methionyl-tRNA formyltransferase [Elusimicrobiaceae bacterium]